MGLELYSGAAGLDVGIRLRDGGDECARVGLLRSVAFVGSRPHLVDPAQIDLGEPIGGLWDGGQIVRVELPRSALANFGLPVNMDRSNEKVKADVLFGVDGLAHAIRFIQ